MKFQKHICTLAWNPLLWIYTTPILNTPKQSIFPSIIHKTQHALQPNTHYNMEYLSPIFYLQRRSGIYFSKSYSSVITQPSQKTWVMFCLIIYQPYVTRYTISLHMNNLLYISASIKNDATVFVNFMESYVLTTSKSHLLSLPKISPFSMLIFIIQTHNNRKTIFVSLCTYQIPTHCDHIFRHLQKLLQTLTKTVDWKFVNPHC